MKSLPAEEFLKLSKQHPIIDVRTPAEFEHGHIPGAVNIPLFSNEERAIIGTLYKHEGKKASMLKGMELVSPQFSDYIRSAERVSNTGTLLVHCWRGGMRSEGMAWLFEWYGFNVFTLKNGYKAFRNMALETFKQPRRLKILGGRTGSGKTLVLKEIEKLGKTIIDLEALAHHKGSAFGTLGEETQPTQEMFENELAVSLLTIPFTEEIWVEDESQNIGKRVIPNDFFALMRAAGVYYIDLPLEKRVEYLVDAYGKYRAGELIESIEKIRKRVGFQHSKAAIEAIKSGDIKKACEISLVYYDKSYDHGIAKRNPAAIHKVIVNELHPEDMAKNIISIFL